VTFLENGSLFILLMQAAIPTSMLISRLLMGTKYLISQYIGAVVVVIGIVVVLMPTFIYPEEATGSNPALWAFISVISCVPMCLSSVYKEISLGEADIDAVYLNGWVAVFQFIASLPLLLPSGPLAGVPVGDIGQNLADGMRCLGGHNSILNGTKPDNCGVAPAYVSIYILFNLGYNVLIILILKFGSANLLWLALTIMVPMANITFALPFVPNNKPLKPTDIIGLVAIMGGLITYRFYGPVSSMILKCVYPHRYDQLPVPAATPEVPQAEGQRPEDVADTQPMRIGGSLSAHSGRKTSKANAAGSYRETGVALSKSPGANTGGS